jgi:hypothetical protein
MSGGNIVRTDGKTSLQQGLPFYIAVAGDTRIRCAAVQILVHKIVHDICLEFFFEIHNIIWNIKDLCHSSGIVNGRKAAASPVFFLDQLRLVLPNLHGYSDHIVTLFF